MRWEVNEANVERSLDIVSANVYLAMHSAMPERVRRSSETMRGHFAILAI